MYTHNKNVVLTVYELLKSLAKVHTSMSHQKHSGNGQQLLFINFVNMGERPYRATPFTKIVHSNIL